MDLLIKHITTDIIDIPIKRPHQFSTEKITTKSFMIVRLHLTNDIEGIGEGTTPGIWWNGESVETMKLVVDQYIKPLLLGKDPRYVEQILALMDRHIRGNSFAKAAVEMSIYDALGHVFQVPVHQLLGGAFTKEVPIRWALASGSIEGDINEGIELYQNHTYQTFKIKSGKESPEKDVIRSIKIAEGLQGYSAIGVDPNGSWNRLMTKKWMEELNQAGVEFLEQPLAPEDIDGMSDLVSMKRVPIMADEGIASIHDARQIVEKKAADIFSLKIHKFGGMRHTLKVGALAESAGICCFGGTSLETSIGTAANLHAFCTLRNLDYGAEIFGPDWLKDDLVVEPLKSKKGTLTLPEKPGLGIELDETKFTQYKRHKEENSWNTTMRQP
ncbi:muconate/chloromuconate family cycloisomerase [Piscibacillus halophilus]|uniref:Muconate cycloisomerase n=1 Tax=Piscibacillus halophilus TaxID=571933 RepID=A0A1H9B3F1_9BACI|nr:muconate/chloromuconate family cycloisomerase [Piscibacillus halophilus]SEP83580.1 muconate cycloisomerase [Piscibacillus halophilus]